MDKCPSCSCDVMPNAKFCVECGHKLAKPTGCPKCNAEVKPSQRFCFRCGHQLKDLRSASSSYTAPATQTRATSFAKNIAVPTSSYASTSAQRVSISANTIVYVMEESVQQQIQSLISGLSGNSHSLVVKSGSAISQVQQFLQQNHANIDAVCLIGSPDTLPFEEIPDPTGKDMCVYTDNGYGMTKQISEEDRFTGMAVSEVPVSRIPTEDIALIQRLLDTQSSLYPSWKGGVALCAEVWKAASAEVLRVIAPTDAPELLISPPDTTASSFHAGVGRFYGNVHGSNQASDWYGEGNGDYPVAVEADFIKVQQNAIAMCEACYGADVSEESESIALRFLTEGAGCFVGSTVVAWGPAAPPISLADRIIAGTYQNLDAGMPLAEALFECKLTLQEELLKMGQPLDPAAHNTLHSFVCYGAPLKRVHPTNSGNTFGTAQQQSSYSSTSSSVLSRMRTQMRSGNMGVMGRVRDRLRKRLPAGTWKVLSQTQVHVSQIQSSFPNYEQIHQEMSTLLGAIPEHFHVHRYKAGYTEHSFISASTDNRFGKTHAAIVQDKWGKILHTYRSHS